MRKVPKAEIDAKVEARARHGAVGRASATAARRSSRAASSSASRWPARSCSSPQLVLMDEPLGALDKQLREHMQFEIKHLHERLGVTLVYVTHDQCEALTMSDRVAVFNDGRIQQLAGPTASTKRPANGFVASFIGENTVLDGVVTATAGPAARWACPTARASPA